MDDVHEDDPDDDVVADDEDIGVPVVVCGLGLGSEIFF